jgi:hypothetical protein
MRIGFLGAIVAATVSVTACAYQPSNLASRDYGPAPTDYQATIKDFMQTWLIDPESARYSNWRGPIQGWTGGAIVQDQFGWLVCVDVNAKNTFGGYTGVQTHSLLIRNDRVIDTRQGCNISG